MDNARTLLKTGKILSWGTTVCILVACIGICGLLITVGASGRYATRYLGFYGPYAIVNILVGLWYTLIGLGVFGAPYCFALGLILIGLGQIALNTSAAPQNVTFQKEPVAPKAPAAPQAEAPAAPAPQPAPSIPHPANQSAPKAGPSLALTNSLRHALEAEFDQELVARLKNTKDRLTRPNEKQLVQQILDAPAGQTRTLAQLVYDKLTANTQP